MQAHLVLRESTYFPVPTSMVVTYVTLIMDRAAVSPWAPTVVPVRPVLDHSFGGLVGLQIGFEGVYYYGFAMAEAEGQGQ